jgi:hypothetical protein
MDYLKKYKLEYEIIPWRPFDTEPVKAKTDRKDIWFWGSIDTGIELQKQGWYPGIMYNDNHDFQIYKEKYGENLLNYDSRIQSFGHIFGGFPLFIRPTRDTKIFTAKVYGHKEWNEYVDETIDSKTFLEIQRKTKMMTSSPKELQQEIRCWIIDGEPVTMSQYRIGRRTNMMNMDNNQEAYIFAKDMAKLYCPSRIFVLDICLYQDDYKIVEINCANMSGFYDIDMSKLLQTLEKTFSNENREIKVEG